MPCFSLEAKKILLVRSIARSIAKPQNKDRKIRYLIAKVSDNIVKSASFFDSELASHADSLGESARVPPPRASAVTSNTFLSISYVCNCHLGITCGSNRNQSALCRLLPWEHLLGMNRERDEAFPKYSLEHS